MVQNGHFFARRKRKLPVKMMGMTDTSAMSEVLPYFLSITVNVSDSIRTMRSESHGTKRAGKTGDGRPEDGK